MHFDACLDAAFAAAFAAAVTLLHVTCPAAPIPLVRVDESLAWLLPGARLTPAVIRATVAPGMAAGHEFTVVEPVLGTHILAVVGRCRLTLSNPCQKRLEQSD